MQIVRDFEGDEFERNDGKRKRERSERGNVRGKGEIKGKREEEKKYCYMFSRE